MERKVLAPGHALCRRSMARVNYIYVSTLKGVYIPVSLKENRPHRTDQIEFQENFFFLLSYYIDTSKPIIHANLKKIIYKLHRITNINIPTSTCNGISPSLTTFLYACKSVLDSTAQNNWNIQIVLYFMLRLLPYTLRV